MPHPISKWPTRPLSHSLYPGYKNGLRTPVQCQFSLALAHCPNSLSHSNKLSLSFCLTSGKSFPNCTQTTTGSTNPNSCGGMAGLLNFEWFTWKEAVSPDGRDLQRSRDPLRTQSQRTLLGQCSFCLGICGLPNLSPKGCLCSIGSTERNRCSEEVNRVGKWIPRKTKGREGGEIWR